MEIKIDKLQVLEKIGFNYEEIKKDLAISLNKYTDLVVTEDAISEAKQSRANLNKLATALNDEKIRIKKLQLKPLEEFEIQIKELIAMIAKPSDQINDRVKEFETKVKSDKRDEIEVYFNSINTNTLVKFDNIFEIAWLNSGFKIKSIKIILDVFLRKTEDELQIIKDLKSVNEFNLIDKYISTFDLGEVLKENQRIIALKAELDKPKIKEVVKEEVREEVVIQPIIEKEPEIEREVSFKVTVTDTQLALLKNFLVDNKIKYGKA